MNIDQAVIVALGSNLAGAYASSEAVLEAAIPELAAAGLVVVRRSRWWRSAAWPDPAGPEYLNGVVLVETSLGVEATLAALHQVEATFGRERGPLNSARTLDLDLISHGRAVVEGNVQVPHPRAAARLFVMGPLAEIAPDWRHPVSGMTAVALAGAASVGTDASP